jgi:hypothetical protein
MNDPYDFVLVRKPELELPPPFVCIICQRKTIPDRWALMRGETWRHKPPICFSCANNDGIQVRPKGFTRGDHQTLQRLSAVISALAWEVCNHGKWWN